MSDYLIEKGRNANKKVDLGVVGKMVDEIYEMGVESILDLYKLGLRRITNRSDTRHAEYYCCIICVFNNNLFK